MTEKTEDMARSEEWEKRLAAMENRLRETEGYYRSLYEISPDIIYRLDAEGRIMLISPAVRKLGYEPGELIGKRFEEIVHPDDQSKSHDHFVERRVGDRRVQNLEIRLLTKQREVQDYELKYLNVSLSARGQWDVPDSDIGAPDKKFICTQGIANDITVRKQAYEELQKKEEYFRAMIENSLDIVFIVDEKGFITYASPSINRILGYEQRELIGRGAAEIISPQDRKRAFQDFYRALASKGAVIPNTFRVLRKDGTERILDGYGKNMLESPVVAGFIINVRDITERVMAEEMFRKEKHLNEAIVQSSPAFFVAIDGEGRTLMMNRAMLAALGFRADEVVGKGYLHVFVPESDRKNLQTVFDAMVRDGRTTLNVNRVVAKDGKILVVEWHGRPVYKDNREFDFFVGLGIDITERRQAEDALRNSEELNSKLLAAVPDFVVRTDIQGHIEFINDVGLKISGYERDEVIGAHMFSFLDPQERDRALTNYKLMLEGSLVPMEYRFLMKDGKISIFEVNGDMLRNEDGTPYGMVFVCRNVTERKQGEEDRHRLESQLLQAQKMEAVGTLAGGIAHDFNNLLMGIQGYVSLMLLEISEDHPHRRKLRAIEEQVKSGADLTRQLLGFARGGRYEVKPTDLNDLVAKTAAMFGRTRKEILIHEKYQREVWPVEVDRGQIEQVMLNMFLNAWQAMPGGGDLYLETENVYLDASYVVPFDINRGRYVKLSVTDTGIGMDEPTRRRIFDPFFTTKGMGRGTGLGLASAYGIIKGHGGFVNVYSEKGHGSTFNIYLPASENKVDKDETIVSEVRRGNETVLLVDDETTVIEVTRDMLAGMGYHVLVAESGAEAIEIYAAQWEAIDLVILDMVMPGMGGGQLYERLKEINPSVRAILSSGYSMNGMAKAIMDKGVRLFLQKPFRLDELSRRIRDALSDGK